MAELLQLEHLLLELRLARRFDQLVAAGEGSGLAHPLGHTSEQASGCRYDSCACHNDRCTTPAPMTTATTAQGFAYTREQFQTLVEDVLQ
ncbi:MAG TPA: hypothetical protein VF107_14200, partial [Burkholderiaceae bacterium]